MCRKDVEGIANCVDPDQTALLGTVGSGSALFAQTYLSENLGSLWYAEGVYTILLVSVICHTVNIRKIPTSEKIVLKFE